MSLQSDVLSIQLDQEHWPDPRVDPNNPFTASNFGYWRKETQHGKSNTKVLDAIYKYMQPINYYDIYESKESVHLIFKGKL